MTFKCVSEYLLPKIIMLYISVCTWIGLKWDKLIFYKNKILYRVIHDSEFAYPPLYTKPILYTTDNQQIEIYNVSVGSCPAKYRFIHFLNNYWLCTSVETYNNRNGFNMRDFEKCFGKHKLIIDYQTGNDIGTGRNIKRHVLFAGKYGKYVKTDLSQDTFTSELVFDHVDFDN